MRCEEARTLADSIGEAHAATRDALCRALDERSDVLKLFEADKRRVKKTPEARGARGTTLDSTDDEDEDEDEDDAAAPRPTDSSIRHLGLFGEDDEDDEEEEDDDEEEVEAGDDEEEDDDEEVTPARKRRRVEPDSEESD
jgi:hypothetical protein